MQATQNNRACRTNLNKHGLSFCSYITKRYFFLLTVLLQPSIKSPNSKEYFCCSLETEDKIERNVSKVFEFITPTKTFLSLNPSYYLSILC